MYVLCLQTVAHARMEQQLYGSSNRTREDDSRVISGKQRSLGGAGEAGRLVSSNARAAPCCMAMAAGPCVLAGTGAHTCTPIKQVSVQLCWLKCSKWIAIQL
jgi:hypothetical protein